VAVVTVTAGTVTSVVGCEEDERMATTVVRRTAAGAVAVALAATIAGCAAYNGNGDSVTPNGVTSEPAGPSPDANG
jgi:hypothetical protein